MRTSMNNFEIKKSRWGQGSFAVRDISEGELIVDWSDGRGQVYECEKASDLPEVSKDHAIQFEEHKWIDHPDGRNINHSCTPNCGWRGRFQLVAMRNIKEGEELFVDYDTMEDSDWVMPSECKCGTPRCRKVIKGFRFLPRDVVEEYVKGKYISEWLIEKYQLNQ